MKYILYNKCAGCTFKLKCITWFADAKLSKLMTVSDTE